MSSVQYLTDFVNERLTAAVDEIVGVFKRCVVEYEEEIDRQRRLLDIVWKPEIKLHRIELPQQYVTKEEEEEVVVVLPDQQRSFSVDQEDPGPPQVKVEQEELTPAYEESDISEDQTLLLNPGEEKEPVVNTVQSSVALEPNNEHQLLSDNSDAAESRDHARDNHGNSRAVEPKPKKRRQKSSCGNNLCTSTMLKIHLNAHGDNNLLKCDTCGKAFKHRSKLTKHTRIHTDEKPYICKTCGKAFRWNGAFSVHKRTHTGEEPYFCKICGKAYTWYSNLTLHMRTHTGEKPYICSTCGKGFCQISDLRRHIRTHTGEKPYACKTCGKRFKCSGHLKKHTGTHTV